MNRKTDRSRAPKLNADLLRVIQGKALNTTAPRGVVAGELIDDFEKQGLIAPKQETLERLISKYRNSKSPEDAIWSLGSLTDKNSNVSPSAVHFIFAVQYWLENQVDQIFGEKYQPITIRQAKWISYLHSCVVQQPQLEEKHKRWLWRWSKVYAIEERFFELSGLKGKQPFDTRKIDDWVRQGASVGIVGDNEYMVETKDGQGYVGTSYPGDEDIPAFEKDGEQK